MKRLFKKKTVSFYTTILVGRFGVATGGGCGPGGGLFGGGIGPR